MPRLFLVGALVALLFAAACLAGSAQAAAPPNWSSAATVLTDAIANGAFPGCVAVVGSRQGYLWSQAFGHFTYGIPPPMNGGAVPPMTFETIFDLASVSKVTGALAAISQFYQRGELSLDTPVASILGDSWNQNGKAKITIENLLLHNSGFPPDPSPNYWDPAFGCPQTTKPMPAEDWSCNVQIWQSLMAQTLENPIGSTYVYSDLNFMTLAYVSGYLARSLQYVGEGDLLPQCQQGTANNSMPFETSAICYYEAYLRHFFYQPAGLNIGYLPPPSWWPNAAPAENDTVYTHKTIQGQVSDGNAYAAGGIAGHAGLFADADSLAAYAAMWLFAPKENKLFVNATTTALFTKIHNTTQSSRALGWNTNSFTVFDEGWNNSCGNLSASTFMHIGYTGTQICCDPVREIYTIFLTNRVYPSAANEKIAQVRQKFNTAVQQIVDAMGGSSAHYEPWVQTRTAHRGMPPGGS